MGDNTRRSYLYQDSDPPSANEFRGQPDEVDYDDTPIPITPDFHRRPPMYIPGDNDSLLIPSNHITPADVLCGRGAGANTHPGNVTFRTLIGDYQQSYLSAKAVGKAEIAKGVVSQIHQGGGRFMKRSSEKSLDGRSAYWTAISDKAAREKVCQALRERGPTESDIPKFGVSNVASLPINHHHHPGYRHPSYSHPYDSTHHYTRITVHDRDVLFGRGGVTNSHSGNQHYRSLVRSRQKEYLEAAKLKKAGVAMKIVEEILAIGGRFMVERHGQWIPVSKEKAREKTSQALREKAPELRKMFATVARRAFSSKQSPPTERKNPPKTGSSPMAKDDHLPFKRET